MSKKLVLAIVLAFCAHIAAAALPALALGYLVDAALSTGARLVLQNVARQTLITVGVAANDASWLASTAGWVARAASILRITSATSTYEVPVDPEVKRLPPALDSYATPITGTLGSYNNPIPFTDPGLVFMPNSWMVIPAWQSKDGFEHKPERIWRTLPETISYLTSFYNQHLNTDDGNYFLKVAPTISFDPHGSGQGADPIRVYLLPDGDLLDGDSIYVGRYHFFPYYRCLRSNPNNCDPYYYNVYETVEVKLSEKIDGVKRFARTKDGFVPEVNDPDWTADDVKNFGSASSISFQGEDDLVNVSANNEGTVIQSATQVDQNVLYRSMDLNKEVLPTNVQQQFVPNASASAVIGAVAATQQAVQGLQAGNVNQGGNNQTIQFPDDYAREATASAISQNTAKAAAALTESKNVDDPTFDEAKFKDAFFKDTFSKLLSWQLPGHTSKCPTSSFDWLEVTYVIDAHCDLLDDHRSEISTAMVLVFTLSALFIVLKA